MSHYHFDAKLSNGVNFADTSHTTNLYGILLHFCQVACYCKIECNQYALICRKIKKFDTLGKFEQLDNTNRKVQRKKELSNKSTKPHFLNFSIRYISLWILLLDRNKSMKYKNFFSLPFLCLGTITTELKGNHTYLPINLYLDKSKGVHHCNGFPGT